MKKNNRYFWLQLIGWALLCHIILVALSFLEVWLYSVIINPGQEDSVYHAHAAKSAPYVAIIFGIVVFYLVARFLVRKRPTEKKLIALGLPLLYAIIDVLVLIPMGVDWASHFLVFVLSFGSKFLASIIGANMAIAKNS